MTARARRRFSTPGLALLVALFTTFGLACVKPPPIVGAPCPCGEGFVCQDGSCQVAPAPKTSPTPTPASAPPAPNCADPGPRVDLPLAADEYRNTVRDLLGVTLDDAELPREMWRPAYPPPSREEELAPLYQALAKRVAERAVETVPELFACENPDGAAEVCLVAALRAFGARAFRRPITGAESDLLLAAYRQAANGQDLAAASRAVIETALADRAFYRRPLAGRPFAAGAPITGLDAWGLASRLSYLFWRSMPDQELLVTAEKGQLETTEDIDRQARRLLAHPRTLDMLTHFLRDRVEVGVGDLASFSISPAMPPEVHLSTLRSLEAFGERYILREDRPHGELMTLPQIFADRPMSTFYGLETPIGSELEAVMPRAGQIRRGLLTSPAWLSRFSHEEQSAPILRGSLVSRRFLCDYIKPPPNVDVPPLPPAEGIASTRDQVEQHSQNPSCAVCHQLFDPLGFGLENYDGMGRWRTHQGNQEIEPSGIVNGTSFRGPSDLADYLASEDKPIDCVVLEWFRFAFGRPEQPLDDCTLVWLKAAFRAGGLRTGDLLLSLTRTDTFRSLRTPHHPAIP